MAFPSGQIFHLGNKSSRANLNPLSRSIYRRKTSLNHSHFLTLNLVPKGTVIGSVEFCMANKGAVIVVETPHMCGHYCVSQYSTKYR